MLKELKAGKKLSDLARGQSLEMGETGLFPRSYGNFVPSLGNSEELARTAFGLTLKKPAADRVFNLDGRFVVVSLTNRVEADPSKLTEQLRDELRTSVLASKQESMLGELLEKLKSEANIKVEPALQSILEGEKAL
jgi:peptidyl-prolyl cis-trans isomerase D